MRMSTTLRHDPVSATTVAPPDRSAWKSIVARYQGSDITRSLFQLISTSTLLILAFVTMHWSLGVSYWLTLALSLPTAGLLVRTFIIMHDCAHGSFFSNRRANEVIGYLTGVVTLTPFEQWRRDHALHHASSGDLDRRGHGDINTITVREYLARDRKGRLKYRAFRHPFTLLILGPLYLMVNQRFRAQDSTATREKQERSVWTTNLGIVVAFAVLGYFFGHVDMLKIYLPSIYLAAMMGVWLFYVQHQFEDAYWQPHQEWDYVTSAIAGSSYLRLPRVLQWFSGSIGLHHVHHLGPKIPNYRLQRAHDENPLFHKVTVISFADTFRLLNLSLWDEDAKQLVRFRDVAHLER
jgi:omega-6 fatty acid desaturase (delta-12 desaturase)